AVNATVARGQGVGTIVDDDNAPVARDDAATTDEDTAVTVNVLANDTDPDGDTLTVTGVTPAAHGMAAVNADGTGTYTPAANFHGRGDLPHPHRRGRGLQRRGGGEGHRGPRQRPAGGQR